MMSDVDSLREAKNFDKEFIDAMIPHHQSAVVMANQVVADGNLRGGSAPSFDAASRLLVSGKGMRLP
jgi:predicted outer membrane protein